MEFLRKRFSDKHWNPDIPMSFSLPSEDDRNELQAGLLAYAAFIHLPRVSAPVVFRMKAFLCAYSYGGSYGFSPYSLLSSNKDLS